MESTNLIDRITPLFREVFDDDGLVITPEMAADDIDGWDSLSHIRLIVSHEIEFCYLDNERQRREKYTFSPPKATYRGGRS